MEELPYQNLATIADKVTKQEERVARAIQSICSSQKKITPDHLLQHLLQKSNQVDLPCCVRKKIHDTFPCEDSQCSRLDCPTHCAFESGCLVYFYYIVVCVYIM